MPDLLRAKDGNGVREMPAHGTLALATLPRVPVDEL